MTDEFEPPEDVHVFFGPEGMAGGLGMTISAETADALERAGGEVVRRYVRADLCERMAKRLNWMPLGSGNFLAVTAIRIYNVFSNGELSIYITCGVADGLTINHGSIEEAKAAAQAHFEKLVRECLE